MRAGCQHYDKTKAQLILQTEAGAWWWEAVGSNMSGQAWSADLSGQKHWQVYVFNVCLMEEGESEHHAICHLTLPLSTQLNRGFVFPPSQTETIRVSKQSLLVIIKRIIMVAERRSLRFLCFILSLTSSLKVSNFDWKSPLFQTQNLVIVVRKTDKI